MLVRTARQAIGDAGRHQGKVHLIDAVRSSRCVEAETLHHVTSDIHENVCEPTEIMTHHDHDHPHHGHDPHHGRKSKGLHKDWRTWLVVGLMLAAMLIYVLTLDESLQPGVPPAERMPAAAE
jgi:hypothetical protein